MRGILAGSLLLVAACASAPDGGGSAPPPAASAAERVVQAQLEAYNARDVDAFVATYAEDVRIFAHPDRLQMSGADSLRAVYGELFRSAPQLRATITRRIVQGNYVIDHESVTGMPGQAQTLTAVAIYEVRDGRIQNVWFLQ